MENEGIKVGNVTIGKDIIQVSDSHFSFIVKDDYAKTLLKSTSTQHFHEKYFMTFLFTSLFLSCEMLAYFGVGLALGGVYFEALFVLTITVLFVILSVSLCAEKYFLHEKS